MANLEDEFSIFGLSVEDLDTGDDKQTTSDLYKPSPDNGKNGVYESLIRFLPNVKNPRKPYIRKYVYWLEDSEGKGFYVDSPSTVGDKCPVQDMFFKLRNSESAIDKKNSEQLKRKEVYYALIQVVDDANSTDDVGKVKVWRFGYKIKQKIDDELNPKYDEPTQVFDVFEGKNFELNISKLGGFPNYDSCKFQSKIKPMKIGGEDVTDSAEGRKAILEYLGAAPDLSNFDYKPWDEDTRKRVEGVLSKFTSPGSAVKKVTNTESTKAKATKPADETAKTVNVESDEDAGDLDDFINGLDL